MVSVGCQRRLAAAAAGSFLMMTETLASASAPLTGTSIFLDGQSFFWSLQGSSSIARSVVLACSFPTTYVFMDPSPEVAKGSSVRES